MCTYIYIYMNLNKTKKKKTKSLTYKLDNSSKIPGFTTTLPTQFLKAITYSLISLHSFCTIQQGICD